MLSQTAGSPLSARYSGPQRPSSRYWANPIAKTETRTNKNDVMFTWCLTERQITWKKQNNRKRIVTLTPTYWTAARLVVFVPLSLLVFVRVCVYGWKSVMQINSKTKPGRTLWLHPRAELVHSRPIEVSKQNAKSLFNLIWCAYTLFPCARPIFVFLTNFNLKFAAGPG